MIEDGTSTPISDACTVFTPHHRTEGAEIVDACSRHKEVQDSEGGVLDSFTVKFSAWNEISGNQFTDECLARKSLI